MKKIVTLFICLFVAVGLFGCSSNGGSTDSGEKETITLKVWGPQEEQPVLEELVAGFIEAHPEKEWDITFGVVGEDEALSKLLEDPAAGADVFAVPDTMISILANAGAIYEVQREEDLKYLSDEIMASSVNGATIDGKVYGYPETADNGYFLYYDKSVLSDEDVLDLDKLLDTAQAAGKKFLMEPSGYYLPAFFLASGCYGYFDSNNNIVTDFNGPQGLLAAQAIQNMMQHPAYMRGDDSIIASGVQDRSICAVVTGTWNAEIITEAWGDDLGATKLPEFTNGDGTKLQMSSYAGNKILCVNSQTAHPAESMDLAMWLISEESQTRRYEIRGIGPSNIKVADTDAVKANIPLSALQYQNQFGQAQPASYEFYLAVSAFGEDLLNGNVSDLQAALDALVEAATSANQ